MFDTILVPANLLPLPANEAAFFERAEFQTKSLDRTLATYRITDNGLLEEEKFDVSTEINSETRLPETRRTNKLWEQLPDVHGYLVFYTSIPSQQHKMPNGVINNEWVEFLAKFTDGHLVSITRIAQGSVDPLPCLPNAEKED